jgi:hypothetical protein
MLGFPGGDGTFFMPQHAEKSTGLLPNDRTHVFKLVTLVQATDRLGVGSLVSWQSGTPLTEFGGGVVAYAAPGFVTQRGTAGRTPSVWDLNLRLAYTTAVAGSRSRVVLDFLHVGNPRRAVVLDQRHYWALDEQGNQTAENPNYRKAIAFQPPMSARLGLEIDF